MAKKLTACTFIIILLAASILSGCAASNIIDSKVKTAIGGTSRSDEAIAWLVANEDMIIPELLNRMSNAVARKSRQAAEALMAMGDTGRQGAIRLFDTMTDTGKNMWCTVLAEEKSKQAVIELLIISEHDGAFDMAVSALISMGDVSLDYLASQLHNPYYSNTADTVLANFGQQAVDLIIPAVHSTDVEKVNRALVILTTVGESAAEALARDALVNSQSTDEARRIAQIMLKNYPETSITAIMSALDADTDRDTAAALLYEISGDTYISQVLTQSSLGEAQKTSEVLDAYVELCGIDPVLNLAFSGDDSVAAGAEQALSGGKYDSEVLSAILKSITASDTAGTKIDTLAGKLISDTNKILLAHSVIVQDADTFAQLALGGIDMGTISAALSGAAENPEIYSRMSQMTAALSGDSKKALLTALASCSDASLPTIPLTYYAQGGDDGNLAAEALTTSLSASGKFMFSDVDMTPYANKIIEGLTGGDSGQKSYAQIILSRVSTSKSNNEFYTTVFSHYKDMTVFSILAGHYGGSGALPLNLSLDVNGEAMVPETVTIKKTGDVKNVSSDNEPDYNALVTGFAPYMGWSQIDEGADIVLEFDCDITPRSKRYPGLLAASYLGAEATGTLTAYVNGEKIKSSTGHASILPPDDYPGPSGEFRYKSDPQDAPAEDVYVASFINAMYNLWGEKALFGLYNFDINATNQAVQDLLGG